MHWIQITCHTSPMCYWIPGLAFAVSRSNCFSPAYFSCAVLLFHISCEGWISWRTWWAMTTESRRPGLILQNQRCVDDYKLCHISQPQLKAYTLLEYFMCKTIHVNMCCERADVWGLAPTLICIHVNTDTAFASVLLQQGDFGALVYGLQFSTCLFFTNQPRHNDSTNSCHLFTTSF